MAQFPIMRENPSKDRCRMKKLNIRDMAQIALFAVLSIIGGKIAFPLLMIPITLQFPVCLLTGIVLGARKAMLAQLVYILLGLAGLPVFAAGGGPGYVLQPSFGYLPGMLLCAGLVGYLADRFDPARNNLKVWQIFPVNLAGMVIVYGLGVTYLYLIKQFYAGTGQSFLWAIQVGALPFLVTDSLFCFVTALAGPLLRQATRPFFRPARPLSD
jgi:biotin transport system substrate-specific component